MDGSAPARKKRTQADRSGSTGTAQTSPASVMPRIHEENELLHRLMLELEAYQQELFESERHNAWLAAERQGLLGQIAYLEALPRTGEPMTELQKKLLDLENSASIAASYIKSLESWVSRAEERAAAAEAEIQRLRSETRL